MLKQQEGFLSTLFAMKLENRCNDVSVILVVFLVLMLLYYSRQCLHNAAINPMPVDILYLFSLFVFQVLPAKVFWRKRSTVANHAKIFISVPIESLKHASERPGFTLEMESVWCSWASSGGLVLIVETVHSRYSACSNSELNLYLLQNNQN